MKKQSIVAFVLGGLLAAGGMYLAYPYLHTGTGVEGASTLSVEDLKANKDFYTKFDVYAHFFDDETEVLLNKLSERLESDKELEEMMQLTTMVEAFKIEPQLKTKFDEIIEDVKSKRVSADYFEKNTACTGLIPGIKDAVTEAHSSPYDTSSEEFEVIFYSPTKDKCLYVTSYSTPLDSSSWQSIVYKKVYDPSSTSALETFQVYHPSDDAAEKAESDQGMDAFVKFVLENSNYNADVLDGLSYIY